MKTLEQTLLLDDLQGLLEEQIEVALRSDFRRVEELAERAGLTVEKIVKKKCFGNPEFDDQRRHLIKLYKKLEMMLVCSKDLVSRELQQVGNVRKTFQAYHNKG